MRSLFLYIVIVKNLILCLFCLASFSFAGVSSADTTASSVAESTVDSNAIFRVDGIRYFIGDAFDDSKSHTKYDRWAYDFLNMIHIETRISTVRKLLLFDQGDLVNLNLLLESERFLRDQKFLSDANISVLNVDGKNIVDVKTSDNWTLTIPFALGFSGSEWKYKNLIYGVGVQESNFLGLGQKLGFYFGHDQFRDMLQVEYADPHFLFRYKHLDFLYSYNTDGYLASWKMYVPFLTRSVNQWAYTLEGVKNKRFGYIYGSGDFPKGAVVKRTKRPLDSLPLYNGKEAVELIRIEDFIDDSLSFRFSRSFGGAQRKLYLGATYDYRRTTASEGKILSRLFTDGENAYAIDSASAQNDWAPERKDSRLGFYIKYSNLHYEKIKNYHNAKWTEDVDKGFSVKAQISKNYEQLGAADNDIRLDFWTDLLLGRNYHHLTLSSYMYFYLDHGKRRDFYGKVSGEYMFHPTNSFSTVLSGLVDLYDDANLGYQLTLGGSDGFVGFPTGYYAGQARVYGCLEQRWFPNFEILTLAPVLVGFGSVGETASKIMDINRKDLIYVLGFGIRLVQTKSITRLVNKIDVSFPINGKRKGDAHYSVTTAYTL